MRVRFSNLRCFFLAMRLRRFLMTEPTVRLSVTAPEAGYREMPGRSRQVPYRNVRRHRDANRWSHPAEREPWNKEMVGLNWRVSVSPAAQRLWWRVSQVSERLRFLTVLFSRNRVAER